METEELELFEGSRALMRPAFPSLEAYEAFRQEFYKQVKPELDRLNEARRKSVLESLWRRVD